MKKKIKIISIIIIILIIFTPIYIIYKLLVFARFYDLYANKKIIEILGPKYGNEDENLNNWLKDNTYANQSIINKSNKLKPFIPTEVNWFKPDSEKELLSNIDIIVPDNLEKVKDNLINYRIINWMKAKKKIKTLEELIKYGYPIPPKFETIKETAIYWYLLSRYLEKTNDNQSSLILSIGILYAARDLEREFDDGYIAPHKAFTREICRIGCKSILLWASKPKPDNLKLSKDLAKDILEYVKSENPASLIIKYNRIIFEKVFNNDVLENLYKKEYYILSSIRSTKDYSNVIYELYEEPLEFIDKPLYEINKELNNYKKNIDKLFDSLSKSKINISLVTKPEKTIILHLIYLRGHDFASMKKYHEQKLAELEFTAIALAINSYASQNGKLPNSMEELSKWFGQELPKNRLTNEPYILDLKGKHLLYNKGIDGIENLDSKDTDDIYFDFAIR